MKTLMAVENLLQTLMSLLRGCQGFSGNARARKTMDESAAPTGSEVLQEAAPERPTLDSTLSSDRPFSPTINWRLQTLAQQHHLI